MAKKKVLVIGDLVYDNNLVRLPGEHLSYSELLPSAVLSMDKGNSWFQAKLVEKACSDMGKGVEVVVPKARKKPEIDETNQIAKAYSLWSPFEKETGSKEKVWRVERFLGCQAPTAKKKWELEKSIREMKPDLLLIDDENLGFRDREEVWGSILSNIGGKTPIVLKASVPLGKSALWKALFESHASQLTLLLSANKLRTQYAAISEALSWDLAIEDLNREFKEGQLASDLSRASRVIVYFNGAGAASYSKGAMDRFVFHPSELEGLWQTHHPGQTFGALSILTASVVRHTLKPADYPLFVALGRAISAIRYAHINGAGKVEEKDPDEMVKSFDPQVIVNKLSELLHPGKDVKNDQLPECEFRSAFPEKMVTGKTPVQKSEFTSDLVKAYTGPGLEYVAARAMQVVVDGPDKALASVPKARYGKYLTVDREEIERINEIRSLIISYSASPNDKKPLSIAVFGPPGSGKSFAIKELAEELFGKGQKSLEFNLSQFNSLDELHQAFHLVRDASIKGNIPFVFWDEFDSKRLDWLKDFLAPMQDAEFREDGIAHPFGKAVFIFAGGTCSSFEEFENTGNARTGSRKTNTSNGSGDGDKPIDFKAVKGPDFISRLRGYVNIKGPNPQAPETKKKTAGARQQTPRSPATLAKLDEAHLIRRAILLRSVIQRNYPGLIDANGRLSMSSSVIRAFLRVERFLHGARSLEAIVSMSSLANSDFFGAAELPSLRLLELHVTDDFMDRVREGEIESDTIDIIAAERHAAFEIERMKSKKSKQQLREEWMALPESNKDLDRVPAMRTIAMLTDIGYHIEKIEAGKKVKHAVKLKTEDLNKLAKIEHETWVRERLMEGWACVKDGKKARKDPRRHIHKDAVCFKDLPEEERKVNRAIVKAIPEALIECDYKLVKRANTK